jgi:hypothetical protein
VTDPDFGRIEWKRGGWTGQVDLWDYPGVQLLLDADENGPSSEQRSFFHTLRAIPAGFRSASKSPFAAMPSKLRV